ncbi:hypothetical protein SETIT_3G344400v2 [Setaria italica]|uniref:Uncharacterized protein n=1 Tax=Setaria italica TaxID=4555 RepID=A0A368QM42_SETIT|nr:hypothetical protein SETIT_3G344400v2 [Setaria italica]
MWRRSTPTIRLRASTSTSQRPDSAMTPLPRCGTGSTNQSRSHISDDLRHFVYWSESSDGRWMFKINLSSIFFLFKKTYVLKYFYLCMYECFFISVREFIERTINSSTFLNS